MPRKLYALLQERCKVLSRLTVLGLLILLLAILGGLLIILGLLVVQLANVFNLALALVGGG